MNHPAINLQRRIQALETVFGNHRLQNLADDSIGPSKVQKYYAFCRLVYFLVHSRRGFIHMGLSQGGIFKKSDLEAMPRKVGEWNDRKGARKVLELAPGNGANSRLLATERPTTEFRGLDLSTRGYCRAPNYAQETGDYHDLSRYEDTSMDVIFIIEALCYSTQKERVFQEVYRKLKPGGYFAVYDGYKRGHFETASRLEALAIKLTEKSMACQVIEPLSSFRKKVAESRLELVHEEDVTEGIIPSLTRLQKISQLFLTSRNPLAALLRRGLPFEIAKNECAGLLMRDLTDAGLTCYYFHVLQKPLSE